MNKQALIRRRRQAKRRNAFIAAGIATAAVIALVIVSFASRSDRSPASHDAAGPVEVRVASSFPSFAVHDVGGNKVTLASLRGKPALLWFTSTECDPCQRGAKRVAAFRKQIGEDKFKVLVLFIPPAAPDSALSEWRSQFGASDWVVAQDAGLSSKIGLRVLDSKYFLDANGVVRNTDFAEVDDSYLQTLGTLVKG